MSLVKVVLFLWPFVKEMVLGEKTVKDAAKDNKMKLLIAFIIVGSLSANYLTIHRLWTMSEEYLELKKRYALLDQKTAKVTNKEPVRPRPVEIVPNPAKEIPQPTSPPKKSRPSKPQTPTVVSDSNERYKKLRDDFEKIKKREEKEGFE